MILKIYKITIFAFSSQAASQRVSSFRFASLGENSQQQPSRECQPLSRSRSRLKINSAITNAIAFLEVKREFGSFDEYVWRFVNGKPLRRKPGEPLAARTKLSDALSKDLGKRGFKFVGSTICYSFMQAVGMVNDHDSKCFRYRQV